MYFEKIEMEQQYNSYMTSFSNFLNRFYEYLSM